MVSQRRAEFRSVAPPGLQRFFGILFPGLAPWAIDLSALRACKIEGKRDLGNLLRGLLNLVLLEIDGAAAVPRPADATHRLVGIVVVIVDAKFLSLSNRPQARIKDMPSQDARHQVGLTRMVDVFRARTAHAAVDGPVIVEHKQVRRRSPPLRFARSDLFAGVLDYFAVRRNILSGINAPAVDLRLADAQSKAAVIRIDLGQMFRPSLGHRYGWLFPRGFFRQELLKLRDEGGFVIPSVGVIEESRQ